MESKKTSPKRFLQFGLRTFLVFVTVLCIFLGRVKTQSVEQAAIVAQVSQINGFCRYDFQFDESGNFDPNGKSYVPQALLDLFGVDFFHDVVEVQFYRAEKSGYLFLPIGTKRQIDQDWRIFGRHRQEIAAEVMDEILTLESLRSIGLRAMYDLDSIFEEKLSKLKDLERITVLKGGDLTDRGIAALKDLENLKTLSIAETWIGDPSLEVLGTMESLEELYLGGHRFSDDGVKHLANLDNLELLCIDGPRSAPQRVLNRQSLVALYKTIRNQTGDVTDEGFRELLGLQKLTRLSICRNRSSKELVTEFKKAIPGCIVTR